MVAKSCTDLIRSTGLKNKIRVWGNYGSWEKKGENTKREINRKFGMQICMEAMLKSPI
jgi:hypothetical protein